MYLDNAPERPTIREEPSVVFYYTWEVPKFLHDFHDLVQLVVLPTPKRLNAHADMIFV